MFLGNKALSSLKTKHEIKLKVMLETKLKKKEIKQGKTEGFLGTKNCQMDK